MIDDRRRTTRAAAAVLVTLMAVAGCVAAGETSSASMAPGSSMPPAGAGSGPAGGGGGGGGSVPGDPGAPVSTIPSNGGSPIPEPTGTLVTPEPVLGETHTVFVRGLAAAPEGGHLIVRLDWVSGVPPCSALARVDVRRDGSTFTLSVLEGPTQLGVACIDIAMYKATRVDLGVLPAGTYVVRADPGDAPAARVAVP